MILETAFIKYGLNKADFFHERNPKVTNCIDLPNLNHCIGSTKFDNYKIQRLEYLHDRVVIAHVYSCGEKIIWPSNHIKYLIDTTCLEDIMKSGLIELYPRTVNCSLSWVRDYKLSSILSDPPKLTDEFRWNFWSMSTPL